MIHADVLYAQLNDGLSLRSVFLASRSVKNQMSKPKISPGRSFNKCLAML